MFVKLGYNLQWKSMTSQTQRTIIELYERGFLKKYAS